jgi:hypothetical protein
MAGLWLMALSVSAATWVVSPEGRDDLEGERGRSPERPQKSIGFAFNTAAAPGDTVRVMNGVCRNPGYGSVL